MQDAHLHLQDLRLHDIDSIIEAMRATGIDRCVVNGTSPEDWQRVATLAKHHPDLIIPSYGLHPWKTPCATNWKPLLKRHLKNSEHPCIGECGLDRWIPNFDIKAQEEAFIYQLDLACELNAPITIHILKAWGWFLDILRDRKSHHPNPLPNRGFLLHSYNGSIELIPELIDAGAYFSFSGYYLNPNKKKQLDVFKEIPIERLLIETDAPDMLPPTQVITHPLTHLNHPANLASIQQNLTDHLSINPRHLQSQFTKNFSRFFLSKPSEAS